MRSAAFVLCCAFLPGCGFFQSGMAITQCSLESLRARCDWEEGKSRPMDFPSANKKEMLDEVMRHLWIGMPMREARKTLHANGFWGWAEWVTNGEVEWERYRRPRASGGLMAHLYSKEVILIDLHPDHDVLRKVSLRYFDRDPDELPTAARVPVSIPEEKVVTGNDEPTQE